VVFLQLLRLRKKLRFKSYYIKVNYIIKLVKDRVACPGPPASRHGDCILEGEGKMMIWQKTLAQPLNFSGIGLHSGRRVEVTIYPASANQGLRFIRTDLPNRPQIRAHYSRVVDTTRATSLGDHGTTLATVEHLLAALGGLGVDNALIEVHGPELPIMDGSAAPFARLISRAGLRNLAWPRAYLMVRETVELRRGEQWMRVRPGVPRITYTIDFDHPLIRRQRYTVPLRAESFQSEIAPARTFGFLKEVQYLQARGLARGGSADNAVVFDEVGVLNPGGLRFPEECVRHKILDAVGDLTLLGLPVLGHLEVGKGSHELHHSFMQLLMSRQADWRLWIPSARRGERQAPWFQAPLWEGATA
jgi:UDP-3-O-[3-hydroxymyristoyl] N-acetylglucosamine deacetylase